MDNSLFNQLLKKTGEYGVVYQISHPIAFLEGLPTVNTREVILFETGQKAEVFAINRGKIEARIFSHEPVVVGAKATRTGQLLSVPVGKELLGHAINPLGEPLDTSVPYTPPKEFRNLEAEPVGISGRQKITARLSTGVSLVDLLIPLGRGQRELIIGDRKTGKTSLLMTTIKKQVEEGMIAIYAAIAKKQSDIKRLQEFFTQEKISDKVIIVATSSHDSPSLIHHTPYAAMSIAEYFKDQGINTLVILDDLSSHAKFYRELSLLARRFPGRDSYPGDIFYTHSSLLERAGNFKHPKVGEVSITCLPVIEIVEGDFTGYVPTNAMGITDGHIYLDSNIYYQGRRPAVNIPLSVTRVGRQTLDKLAREVNKNLTAFLSTYDRLQNLSHFGQELTDDVKKGLKQGDLMYKFFNQPYQETVPLTIQLIIISMIMQDLIDYPEVLEKVKDGLLAAFHEEEPKKWLLELAVVSDSKAFNESVLKNKDKLLELAKVDIKAMNAEIQAKQAAAQPPPQQGQPDANGQTPQQQATNSQPAPAQAQNGQAQPQAAPPANGSTQGAPQTQTSTEGQAPTQPNSKPG